MKAGNMKKLLFIAVVMLTTQNLSGQQVSLYAGTPGTAGFTSGNDLANTKFNQPYGIAIDTLGNIYISEIGGHTIRMITTTGLVYVRAGQYQGAGFYNASGVTSKFNSPRGLAIGPSNEVYVADFNNHVIRKISPFTSIGNAQNVTVFAGKYTSGSSNYTSYPGFADGNASTAQFNYPSGLACDDTGNVYVADYYNHCIRKITPAGNVSTIAGQPTISGFVDGNAKTTAKFNNPSDLFLSGSVLYIADYSNSSIRKFDMSTNTVTTVDSNLWTPTDLVYWNNALLVTDLHRIFKYYNNSLFTYAGSTNVSSSGYTNGYGNAARFYHLKGMVLNPKDTCLYAADMENHVIRKITVCPNITPSITITGDTVFCDGDSVVLTGPSGYARYKWSNGESSSKIVLKNTATVSLQVWTADSCSGISDPVSVTKKKRPTSYFFIDSTYCNGISDTVIYYGNGISAASYVWDFDSATIVSGSGQGPYIINWNKTGSKTVSLQVTENGCTSAKTVKTVKVYDIPVASFSVKTQACLKTNDTVTFTGTASSSAQYYWNFDGATIMSGSGKGPYVVKWFTTGQKNVTLMIKDHNCTSGQAKVTVNVNNPPTAAFSNKSTICEGLEDTVKFTGSAGTGASYQWNFGSATVVSGSGAGPYIIKWSGTGNKSISLTVEENGCLSTPASANINVLKTPTPDFSLKKEVCTDQMDTVTYTGNAGALAFYNWDFGTAYIVSGATKGPFVIYWSSPGQKQVSLQVDENGCYSPIKLETVEVSDAPVAMFNMKTSVCEQEVVTVTFNGTAGTDAVYQWDFAGAEIVSGSGKGPYQIKWNSNGTKKVSLTVKEKSCNSLPYSLNITVKKKPTSTFTLAQEVCEGKPANITYTGNGIASANFVWAFDGATVQSGSGIGPYQLYWTNPGQKTVSLQVNENGCFSETTTHQIIVNPKPPVPTISRIKDTLISSSDSNNQWYKSTGIIAGATDKKFVPPGDGIYYVVVTSSKGCSSQSANYNFIKSSVTESKQPSVSIYPNPTNGKIYIEIADISDKDYEINVLTVTGQVIDKIKPTSGISELNLDGNRHGLYILQIKSNDTIQYFSVIKNENY